MPDGNALVPQIGREVGKFRKGFQQRMFRRRHLALGERQAIEQAEDALGRRTQVMQRVGTERDATDRVASDFVLARLVALEYPLG